MAFRDKDEVITKLEHLKVVLDQSTETLRHDPIPSLTAAVNTAILEGYVGALKWMTGEPDSFDKIIGRLLPAANVNINRFN